MKNLDFIAEELFNKIRGRFPSITIGDGEGKVTDQPSAARFFDFQYKQGGKSLGSVSVTLTDSAVQVMYNTDFVANEDGMTRDTWYSFLKELRMFARKRLLNFDTRNIQKSNLDKRDYKFLAQQRTGDEQMTETKLYGTSRKSYQDIGKARVTIEHHSPVNQELPAGRTQHISRLYIESSEGERFKYPFKHLSGARAMARHVSEGGKPFDDFGKHITGLSEELASLRKFKTYMSRSAVMAEGLGEYTSVVIERIEEIKKRCEHLQRETRYNEAFDSFEASILEDVPSDVTENWIDQLTIRQFNEELKDVFPYIYKLISEKTTSKELGPEDLLDEQRTETYKVMPGDTLYSIAKEMVKDEMKGMDINDAVMMIAKDNGIDDPSKIQPGMELTIPYIMGAVGGDDITGEPITRGLPPEENYSPADLKRLRSQPEEAIDTAFEDLMGQFAETDNGDEGFNDDVFEGFSKGDAVIVNDEQGPGADFSAPGVILGLSSKKGLARVRFGNNKTEILSIDMLSPMREGNAFSKALKKARDNDDDEMEVDGEKIPVTEFILSYYDRDTGQFPKGETAVLTAIEKDYGEEYVETAKQFIEAVNAKFEEFNGYKDPELMDDDNLDNLIKTGVSDTYDFIAQTIKDYEELIRKNPNHPKVPKVKAELAKLKPQLAQARKDSGMGEEVNDIMRLAGI